MQNRLVDSELVGCTLQKRYQIQKRLTKGGMAWVYQAFDEVEQRQVALKILSSAFAPSPNIVQRFKKEFHIHQQLKHPHILQAFHFIKEGDLSGYVMEYIEGQDLKQHLMQQTEFSTQDQIDILLPLVESIAYAHRQGIIHRDLKPGNILLTRQNNCWYPKVIDFGIAKQTDSDRLTLTGETLGTPEYMAPEQYGNSKDVDHYADIYSLGVIFYRMMTGKLPFSGEYHSIIHKKMSEAAPYPEGIAAPIAGLILRCLEREPQNRYDSCDHLLDVLAKFLHSVKQEANQTEQHQHQPSTNTEIYMSSFSEHVSPEELQAVPLPPPQTSPSSDFHRTAIWGEEDSDIDFESEYQKAMELAKLAEEENKQAQLKTMAVTDTKLLDELQNLEPIEAEYQIERGGIPPLWKIVTIGSLLLTMGLLFGWFLAKKGF